MMPDVTFNFTATKVSVDGKTGDADKAIMPSLNGDNLTASFTAADQDANAPVNNVVSMLKETGDIFAGVSFPRAGIYVYEIGESNNTNAGIAANAAHEALSYSQGAYTLTVTVATSAAGSGTYVASADAVVATADNPSQTAGDDIDPTPGGDGDHYLHSQMAFTNTYVKTNGAADPGNPKPATESSLSISKTVTGAYANRSQYFDFHIKLAVPWIVPDIPEYYRAYVVADGAVVVPTNNADASLIETDAGGDYIEVSTADATAFKLKHGQRLVFVDTPVGTGYDVSEADPIGYTPSYVVTADGEPGPEITGSLDTAIDTGSHLVGESANSVDVTNARGTVVESGLDVNGQTFFGPIFFAVAASVVLFGSQYLLRRRMTSGGTSVR